MGHLSLDEVAQNPTISEALAFTFFWYLANTVTKKNSFFFFKYNKIIVILYDFIFSCMADSPDCHENGVFVCFTNVANWKKFMQVSGKISINIYMYSQILVAQF